MIQIKQGDRFKSVHGPVYEIRSESSFRCHAAEPYWLAARYDDPADMYNAYAVPSEVANWPEDFFLDLVRA